MLGLGAGLARRRPVSGVPAPTLDLNFLYGVMPPGVTFTRAGTADYTGVDGVARTAAVDQPRLTAGGLMVFDAAAAGAAEIVTLPLGAWFNAAAGTLLVEFSVPVVTASARIASVNDGTTAERFDLLVVAGGVQFLVSDGGVTQAGPSAGPAIVAGAVVRAAGAYALNNFQVCKGGTLGTLDSAGNLPTVTTLRLGAQSASAAFLNGFLRRLRYYPNRLDDATLQAITA